MNEAAALPSPAVVLSARLKRYYGRLRRPPDRTVHFPALAGYRTPRSDGSQTAGPGRASPVPVATIQTFHALYAGEFIGAALQALHPFHGLHPEERGSALPCPPKRLS